MSSPSAASLFGRILLFAFTLASPGLGAHQPLTARYTFHEHVLPLLESRCGRCHSSRGAGPMTILKYEEARPWAESIKEKVLERAMPPWFAELGHEPLIGEVGLSAREIDVLADWASGGAPAGSERASSEPARPRVPPRGPGGLDAKSFALGEVTFPPSERSHSKTVSIDLALPEDRYLAAWSVEPSDPAFLRSALLFVERPAGEAMFAGSWIAGEEEASFTEGTGLRVEPGSKLRVELRYERPWKRRKEELDDVLRLKLLEATPREEVRMLSLDASASALPAGARLLAFFPHSRAGSGKLVLDPALPSEKPRVLIALVSAPEDWPITYRFRDPPAASERRLRWVQAGGPPREGTAGVIFFALPVRTKKEGL